MYQQKAGAARPLQPARGNQKCSRQSATIDANNNNINSICCSNKSEKTSTSDMVNREKSSPVAADNASMATAGTRVRIVRLHHDGCSKLGFSLRGGKEAARSPVGVFVSHVERRSEADKKGLKVGDLLLQVNRLEVNQATYEEVIGLIKQTPKRQDIVLKVTNLGRVPYQENPGAPIIWIQVDDSGNGSSASSDTDTCRPCAKGLPDSVGKGPASSLTSSSDEGIENYSYSSSCASSQLPAASRNEQQAAGAREEIRGGANKSKSFGAADTESIGSSSGASGSISISSGGSVGRGSELTIEGATLSSASEDDELAVVSVDICDTLIRVPGERRSSEAFGCDVVKGPDEWPGIFVQSVKPASLAERCGLELGDQLVRADNVCLQEMSFEAAIQLIKRLQQQQEELLLHVKKGAALRYLASRQQQVGAAGNRASRVQVPQERPSRQNSSSSNSNNGYKTSELRRSGGFISRSSSSSGSCESVQHGEWAPNGATPAPRKREFYADKLISAEKEMDEDEDDDDDVEASTDREQLVLNSRNEVNKSQIGETPHGSSRRSGQSQDASGHDDATATTTTGGGGKRQDDYELRGNGSNSKWQSKCLREELAGVDAAENCFLQQVNQLESNGARQKRQQQWAKSSEKSVAAQTMATVAKDDGQVANQQRAAVSVDDDKGSVGEKASRLERKQRHAERCESNEGGEVHRDEGEDEDGEIRIVSQSCKLHPHHPHSGLSHSQVLERFPHPAARMQQHQQSANSNKEVPNRRQRGQSTTVDEMRRKLDPLGARHSMQHRQIQSFKSMDNLAQVEVSCPSIQQQQQQQLLQPRCRPPRSSSVSRQPQWPFGHERDIKETYHRMEASARYARPSRGTQRIYRRSASVLGHRMMEPECCAESDETLRYMAEDYARLSAINSPPRQQCCSLARQAHNQRRRQHQLQIHNQAVGINHYGSNTLLASHLGAPSALFRCKAQSMDRLNINLNYLKIGLNQYSRPKHSVATGAKQRALATRQCLLMQASQRNIHHDDAYAAPSARRPLPANSQCQLPRNRHLMTAAACCSMTRAQQKGLLDLTTRGGHPWRARASSPTVSCSESIRRDACSCNIESFGINNYPTPRNGTTSSRCTDTHTLIAPASCTCPCCPQLKQQRRSPISASRPLAAMTRYGSHSALDLDPSCLSVSPYSSGSTSSSHARPLPVPSNKSRAARAQHPLKQVRAPQPPAPPPPPMTTRADRNRGCQVSVTTKGIAINKPPMRLSTFQAANQHVAASDESSAYSQSYFSTSSTCSSASSSLSASGNGGDSSSPVGLAGNATLGRPELIGHQQRNGSPLSPPPTAASRRAPPRPPPLPASSDSSGSKCTRVSGNNRAFKTQLGSAKQQPDDDEMARSTGDGSLADEKPNRLCFVDELKMLAKRQQEELSQQSGSQQQQQIASLASMGNATACSSDHSSTLIKIINASKSAAGSARKGCSYKSCGQSQKSGVASCCSGGQQADPAITGIGKCGGNHSRLDLQPVKSVKLSEEDNKRRQHEMLMKEFKSAHSRMFNKRREATQTNGSSPNSCTSQDDRTDEDGITSESLGSNSASENRTTIKTITTKKINLMLQSQQVHLTAAN